MEMLMQFSMYQATAPGFVHILTQFKLILKKGEDYAAARKIDPLVLTGARLYPDMLPLTRQVQIATDQVKFCMSRLAGTEAPKFEDNEQSFAELQARLDKTIAHIQSFKPAQIDGSESRDIEIKPAQGNPRKYKGMNYLFDSVYPNFFFHVTTAYDILRHNGVEVGKMDFLGDHEHVKR
jgi:uncharacterized protein